MFGWLDGVKRALAIKEVGLQEATQLAWNIVIFIIVFFLALIGLFDL